MYTAGNMSEEFYDNLGYPKDQHYKRNVRTLTNQSLAFGRSQPLITHEVLERRTNEAFKNPEEVWNARISRLYEVNALISQAEEYSKLLFEKANLPPESTEDLISALSLSVPLPRSQHHSYMHLLQGLGYKRIFLSHVRHQQRDQGKRLITEESVPRPRASFCSSWYRK